VLGIDERLDAQVDQEGRGTVCVHLIRRIEHREDADAAFVRPVAAKVGARAYGNWVRKPMWAAW
jgi:hypothetical protein